MNIYLKNIKHYFLTVDTNGERKKHMIETFKEYNLIEVNPILNIGKNKSGATGFCKMIDIALKNQDRTKPFQPFIMYEDDCSKYREFPEYIEVPEDADLLYIGLSKCGIINNKDCLQLYYKNINNNIIKIYNMLAMHGIMVCSLSGALAVQKAVLEGYYKNIIWDIFVASIQPYYNVYALKNPLVYQDAIYKGNEKATKFSIKNNFDQLIPTNNVNTKNDSIITSYKKKYNLLNIKNNQK